jgi:predicted XRE-type DNA-binding protein
MTPLNNAFELLTSDQKNIKNYTMRSNMMNALLDLIQIKGWTQKETAKQLNVSQPRISALKNGKISQFSVGMLMKMLSRFGFSFKFDYIPAKQVDFNISMSVTPPKNLH